MNKRKGQGLRLLAAVLFFSFLTAGCSPIQRKTPGSEEESREDRGSFSSLLAMDTVITMDLYGGEEEAARS